MAERLIDPRNKILRWPERLARMKAGERGQPVNVELDLANVCQLRCRECDFAHVHDGALMSLGLGRRVLEQLALAGARSVTLTGGGEPTCNPHLGELANYAAELGLAVGIYTNGVNADQITANLRSFTWVYVSLDAGDPASWADYKLGDDTVSGRSLFWQVLNNIKGLVNYREGQSAPTVGVGFLLGPDNWRQAEHMAALARDLGADYCQFRPLVGLSHYDWCYDAVPLLDRLMGRRVYVSRERFVALAEERQREYQICRASELVPCVGADGTVWVCPNTRGLRSLGNLASEDFAAIWERRALQWVDGHCRVACRNDNLNGTLDYVLGQGPHDAFV